MARMQALYLTAAEATTLLRALAIASGAMPVVEWESASRAVWEKALADEATPFVAQMGPLATALSEVIASLSRLEE